MRNVMEAILHRRAIRRFDARQVEEGALAQILEAGLYAPSAGGGQRPLFVVCQNRELNLLLGKNKRAHLNIPPQTGQQNGGNRSRVTVEMSPGVRLQVQAVE